MVKKVFLSIMMVAAATLFMTSCNNAADSGDGSRLARQEECYGNYKGSLTVGQTSAPFTCTVTANSVAYTTQMGPSGNHTTQTYDGSNGTTFSWTTDEGNPKCSGRKTSSGGGVDVVFKIEDGAVVGYFSVVSSGSSHMGAPAKITKTN